MKIIVNNKLKPTGTRSSGSSNPITGNYGTYNPYTNVYTDPNGNESSRLPSNLPPGTYTDWNANNNTNSGGSSTSGGGGGSGGGSSSNPLNLPSSGPNIIDAINNQQQSRQTSSSTLPVLERRSPTSIQSGVLLVNSNEADMFKSSGTPQTVPYYILSSDDAIGSITEGYLVGQTNTPSSITQSIPFFDNPTMTSSQIEITTANLQRTKDAFGIVNAFQSNPLSFVESGQATGISTPTGETYQLSPSAFDKLFTPEANLEYSRQGQDYFKSLSPSARGSSSAFQVSSTVGKFGIGLSELNLGKSFVSNIGFQQRDFSKSSSVKLAGVDTGFYVSDFNNEFTNVKYIPESPSFFSESDIPGVTALTGIKRPTYLKDTPGYLLDLGRRPEQLFNIGMTSTIATGFVKGGIAAKQLYNAERLAGSSKMGAMNVVGGEMIYSISPVRYYGLGSERIFITEVNRLAPFKTTQINKGDTLTFVKFGEAGDAQLFTGMGKEITYTPSNIKYISVKPTLEGVELTPKSLQVGQGSLVSLREGNIFAVRPTDKDNVFKISGTGQRDVFQFGLRPVQTSRYELGTQSFFSKKIQNFNTFGRAAKTDFGFDFSFARSTFKTVESQSFFGEYKAFGKDMPYSIVNKGKAFGKGISGRPSTSKGFDIFKETGRIESDFGTDIFGKSYGKTLTGGRKMVNMFNINTKLPNQKGIEISSAGGGNKLSSYPKGITVKNVYTKGEFNYLASKQEQKVMQKGLGTSAKTSLASPKGMNLGLQNIQTGQNVFTLTKTSNALLTANALKLGLQTKQQSVLTTNMFSPSASSFAVSQPIISSQLQAQTLTPLQTTTTVLTPSIFIERTFDFGGGFDYGFDLTPPPGPPLVWLPELTFPGYRTGGRKSGKQRKKRVPTLYAAMMGITSRSASAAEITGIVGRPILLSQYKRRRR